MLTKKKLRKWLNIALLALTGAITVTLWLLPAIPLEGRAVATGGVLTGLLSTLPSLRKQIDETVDKSELPEDAP